MNVQVVRGGGGWRAVSSAVIAGRAMRLLCVSVCLLTGHTPLKGHQTQQLHVVQTQSSCTLCYVTMLMRVCCLVRVHQPSSQQLDTTTNNQVWHVSVEEQFPCTRAPGHH